MRACLAAAAAAVAVTLTLGTAATALTTADAGSRWAAVGGPMVPGPGGQRGMMTGLHAASEHDFLVEMVAHHREAVDAAQELRRSPRAEMRTLGASIVASQSAQIRQMQAWLAAWYPAGSGRADYRPMMRDLTGLSGDQLDRAFLRDMVMHHRGAVMRSQQLLRRGLAEHQDVAALAQTIRDEQRAEIMQMQHWQREWFGDAPQRRPGSGRAGGEGVHREGVHRHGCPGGARGGVAG